MIKIFADSTCDLSQELITRYDVTIIPLSILMDDTPYMDGVETTPDEIYRWSDSTGETPKTSAPTLELILEKMKPFDREDVSILFFGISEDMSTTCNAVRLMSDELSHATVRVIDSMSLSTGIGLQVIRAAELAAQGLSADEIADRIESTRADVQASFVVDTLTFLHRGGRCSSVAALFGSTLHLHPKILVADGKMRVEKKYRGRDDAAILKYVRELDGELQTADHTHVFITHSGISNTVIDKVKDLLAPYGFKEVHVTRAGGVISSHCGPGTLGVLYYRR